MKLHTSKYHLDLGISMKKREKKENDRSSVSLIIPVK